MIDSSSFARLLHGKVGPRGEVYFTPPGHKSSRQPHATLFPDPSAPGGFRVHCHSPADDWRPTKDWICKLAGIDLKVSQFEKHRERDRAEARASRAKAEQANRNAINTKTRAALRLFEEAVPAAGTPVEAFLARRRVELLGTDIRFHPACRFGKSTTRAMIALARDIETGRPCAVHRTALSASGQKIEVDGLSRLSLGPLSGAAIQILPLNDNGVLGVGEGLETALSLRQLPDVGEIPVWSLIAANGLASFPLIPTVNTLVVAVDNDRAGIAAAQECARRWRLAGREVFLIKPDREGADLNDLIQERADA